MGISGSTADRIRSDGRKRRFRAFARAAPAASGSGMPIGPIASRHALLALRRAAALVAPDGGGREVLPDAGGDPAGDAEPLAVDRRDGPVGELDARVHRFRDRERGSARDRRRHTVTKLTYYW